MAQNTGSVWNQNSWHWEEKQCTNIAIERLKNLLDGQTVGKGLVLSDTSVTGEASVSNRKGKRLVALDFDISGCWKDSSNEGLEGTWEVKGLDVDNCKDEEFDIHVTVRVDDDKHRIVKESLRKGEASKEIRLLLRKFLEEFEKADADAAALEGDRLLRETEAAKMKAAAEAKGDEQKKLLAEAKVVDEAKREKAASIAPVSSQQRQPDKDEQAKGQGSVWNVNSYHWEEKKNDEVEHSAFRRDFF